MKTAMIPATHSTHLVRKIYKNLSKLFVKSIRTFPKTKGKSSIPHVNLQKPHQTHEVPTTRSATI